MDWKLDLSIKNIYKTCQLLELYQEFLTQVAPYTVLFYLCQYSQFEPNR